jgi:transcriptional regulator NrdR family protein
MMRCPFCRTAAHVRTSRYMSESVKESYLQCQNVHCSATFKTHESIFEVIRSPVVDEKPAPVPTARSSTSGERLLQLTVPPLIRRDNP